MNPIILHCLLIGILTGSVASQSSSIPYHVLIFKQFNYVCDGTLVSPTQVLVTASCVYFESDPSNYLVSYWFQLDQKLVVTDLAIHPSYQSNSYDYDVAVLTLASPIDSGAQFIAMSTTPPLVGQDVQVSGYGWLPMDGAGQESVPLISQAHIMSQNECLVKLSESAVIIELTDRMVCAINNNPTCVADLGSPLVANNQLLGLLSWGPLTCQQAEIPAAFSDISQLYPWIITQIATPVEVVVN